jgi:hypothetical protein
MALARKEKNLMRSTRRWLKNVCDTLTDRLEQLRASLDGLRLRVKGAVAQIVAETVADAVRDALQALWAVPPSSSDTAVHSSPFAPAPLARPVWRDVEDRPPWYDEDVQEASSILTEPAPPPAVSRGVATALHAGGQAAWWWLRRQPRRWPAVMAVAIGLVAGVVSYAGGPLALSGAGVAMAASGLIRVAAALGAGAAVLASFTSS